MNPQDRPAPIVRVAVDTPLRAVFDYLALPGAVPGRLVRVEFGRREVVGVVVETVAQSEQPASTLKPVLEVFDAIDPLPADWLALCRFAAHYYLRGLGEVMLPALPGRLRTASAWARLRKTLSKPLLPAAEAVAPVPAPPLSPDQASVAGALAQAAQAGGYMPFLLFGVTGSGKTEVYLDLIARLLAADAEAQVLLLVPEINLTPQLEGGLRARFANVPLAVLHSGLAEVERARHWLAAHLGQARIVIGTRLAVLAPMRRLRAIIVDEEHDPSYKQQEGLRYSARDLAVWRAHDLGIPVVLGSATPSLETWWRSNDAAADEPSPAPAASRYRRLSLPTRVQAGAALPTVRVIDTEAERKRGQPLTDGLSLPMREAIAARLARGEQSLLYLNRRGYAPVLACDACGWLSACPRCSAYLVMHRQSAHTQLRCHHCGIEARVPRHCPDCGNVDLAPLGRGTQRVEETLLALFPQARIARIDADATRRKGSAQALFGEVHAGEVDILVGTQMVAKGHDFQRVTLVGILNPDTALVSQDFRASERLFASLMQVAGRAGRAGLPGEVLLQTRYPRAAVYQALAAHDFPGHARSLIAERRSAGLPPFGFQALLTVEAKDLAGCLRFLGAARAAAADLPECAAGQVRLFDPVPRAMVRVAGRERAQLLIESDVRAALQRMLDAWLPLLEALRPRLAWQIERDPVSV